MHALTESIDPESNSESRTESNSESKMDSQEKRREENRIEKKRTELKQRAALSAFSCGGALDFLFSV